MIKRIINLLCFSLLLLSVAPTTLAEYGVQAKTSGCTANQTLPDTACTPGAVLTTNTKVICKVGYTKTVRNVPLSERKKVFAEYVIPYNQSCKYEVDHLISLELGGSNDISNLWPEKSSISNGSLTKDKFENYLHAQVCSGKMTITEAQMEIATNWLKYYPAPIPKVSPGKAKTGPVSGSSGTTAPAPTSTPAAPQTGPTVPAGATGKCVDGTYTEATTHQGACSHHGGVAFWY